MLPISLDFASALSNVPSTARDNSSAASANSFSALLQLAQVPQSAQSAVEPQPTPAAPNTQSANSPFSTDAFSGNGSQSNVAPSESPANGQEQQDDASAQYVTSQYAGDAYSQGGYGNSTAAAQQPVQPASVQKSSNSENTSTSSPPQDGQSSTGSENTAGEGPNVSTGGISQHSSDQPSADTPQQQSTTDTTSAAKKIRADAPGQILAQGVVLDLSHVATSSAALTSLVAAGTTAGTVVGTNGQAKPGSPKTAASKPNTIKSVSSNVKNPVAANVATESLGKKITAPQNASSTTAGSASDNSSGANSGSPAAATATLRVAESTSSAIPGKPVATGSTNALTSIPETQNSSTPSIAGVSGVVATPSLAATAATTDAPSAKAAPAFPLVPRTVSIENSSLPTDGSSDNAVEQGTTGDISFGAVLDAIAARGDAPAVATRTSTATTDAKPAAVTAPAGGSAVEAAAQTGQTAQNTARATTSTIESTATDGSALQSDSARFVQRVGQAFQSVGTSGGSIRLRLSPPDLGDMQINISVQKGTLTADVQTDTAQARNLLLDNLPELRDRLAQHNIKIETFNVSLSGNSSGGTSGQASQYQNPAFGNAPNTGNRNVIGSGASISAVDAPATQIANQNGSLNIVI
jgi:hypothetical protein